MHELQQILLQKLPRLQLPTFGCKIRKGKEEWNVIGITREEDEIGEVLLYRQQGHDDIGVTYLMSREVLLHDRTVEILGHHFTHADILEALGEDWAMTGDYQLLRKEAGVFIDSTYIFEADNQGFEKLPKLPSNISDLSLPEYEETCERLISLIK